MFLIRASLLLVLVSMSWSEGAGEDRIGTILSMMADVRTHVESLTESVKKIEQNEGDVAKKVEIIVKNEGEMEKKVGNIDTQITQMKIEMKTEMAQMKTQIGQLETKVDNVDNDVALFNWKFLGHGYQGSASHYVVKYHTTLQECLAFCTKKRQDSGAAWNGFWWYVPNGECWCFENETGHREDKNFLHFKV